MESDLIQSEQFQSVKKTHCTVKIFKDVHVSDLIDEIIFLGPQLSPSLGAEERASLSIP